VKGGSSPRCPSFWTLAAGGGHSALVRRAASVLALALAGWGCHDWEALSAGADADVALCGGRAATTCDAALEVCDGFDTGTLDAAWMKGSMGGQAMVSAACPYRGDFSLAAEVDAVADGEARRADAYIDLEADGEPVYLRLFARAPDHLPANSLKLASLIQDAEFEGVVLRVDDGFVAVNNTVANHVAASTAAMPVDRWVCLELGIEPGSPGRVQVWIDGGSEPVLDRAENTAAEPPIDRAHVGILGFDATVADPAFALFVDEVAVGAERVGCGD